MMEEVVVAWTDATSILRLVGPKPRFKNVEQRIIIIILINGNDQESCIQGIISYNTIDGGCCQAKVFGSGTMMDDDDDDDAGCQEGRRCQRVTPFFQPLSSSLSRVRPVSVTSLTTVLMYRRYLRVDDGRRHKNE